MLGDVYGNCYVEQQELKELSAYLAQSSNDLPLGRGSQVLVNL